MLDGSIRDGEFFFEQPADAALEWSDLVEGRKALNFKHDEGEVTYRLFVEKFWNNRVEKIAGVEGRFEGLEIYKEILLIKGSCVSAYAAANAPPQPSPPASASASSTSPAVPLS